MFLFPNLPFQKFHTDKITNEAFLNGNKISDSFVTKEMMRITKEQRHIIKETFEILSKEPVENGHRIFVRYELCFRPEI